MGNELYLLANVEKDKKYKIFFNSDGDYHFQFISITSGSSVKKPLTTKFRGISGNYEYKIHAVSNAELYIKDEHQLLPGNVEWKQLSNISVEEI